MFTKLLSLIVILALVSACTPHIQKPSHFASAEDIYPIQDTDRK